MNTNSEVKNLLKTLLSLNNEPYTPFNKMQVESIDLKPLQFFKVGRKVYFTNYTGKHGVVKIENENHARLLFECQEHKLKFCNLQDRISVIHNKSKWPITETCDDEKFNREFWKQIRRDQNKVTIFPNKIEFRKLQPLSGAKK